MMMPPKRGGASSNKGQIHMFLHFIHLKSINSNKYIIPEYSEVLSRVRLQMEDNLCNNTTRCKNPIHQINLPLKDMKHLFECVVVDQVLDNCGEAVTVRELLQAQPAHASRGEDDGVVGQARVVVRIEAGLIDIPLVIIVAPLIYTYIHTF